MVLIISALILIGALAGFLAGLLGIGGGIVLVPGLFYIFHALGYDSDQIMHVAVGTSLALIVPTGFAATLAHWRRGAVRQDLTLRIGVGVVVGAGIGTLIADRMTGDSLQVLFAGALMALAAVMMSNPARFALLHEVPRQPWSGLAGTGIGTLATLMGIGGATISVPYMSLCRVPIREAVGTASALGLFVAVPAMAGFILIGLDQPGRPPWSLGYVNMLAWAAIVPVSVLAAPWGARLAHRLPVDLLRRVFAAFMVVVALRMLAGAIYDQ